MSISRVGSVNSYIYKNVNKSNTPNRATALFDRAKIITASNLCGVTEKNSSFSANDIYNRMVVNSRFRSEIGERYLQNIKDRNTNLLAQSYADSTLIEGIKAFLHTDQITKSVLNDKYSVKVHAYTGIEVLKVRGREGNGSWLIMNDDQQQLDKLQELANLYKEKYPNLVKTDDLARGLALEEVAGLTVRTENGFITVACNGIQYMDNNDQSKGWGVMYSESNTDIYNEIMKAIIEGSIKGGIESVSGWEEWFEQKGYTYERVYSDEELAMMVSGKARG